MHGKGSRSTAPAARKLARNLSDRLERCLWTGKLPDGVFIVGKGMAQGDPTEEDTVGAVRTIDRKKVAPVHAARQADE